MTWLASLFDTFGFPPRWSCGVWSQALGWTHILSDVAIFLAYVAIPVVLAYFVRRRRDLPFPGVVWLFALFILSCGAGHLLEAVIFYAPMYRLAGALKVVTAVASWGTVLALVPIVPKVLALRSAAEFQQEIDRRREVEEELRRKNDELNQFAYVVSHDLKAPVRAIGVTTSFLREDLDRPDEVERHLSAIERRTMRMERLIGGLLEVARAGRVTGTIEPTDVALLLAELRDSLDAGEAARVEVRGALPTFFTYRLGLEQVLTNLVVNAIRHSKSSDSTVVVSVDDDPLDDDCYRFVVEDDGPGVDPAYRERIFTIFQTLEARDVFESTGVGLAVVMKVVEGVGGSVWVEDASIGGAAFVVRWPKRLRDEPGEFES